MNLAQAGDEEYEALTRQDADDAFVSNTEQLERQATIKPRKAGT